MAKVSVTLDDDKHRELKLMAMDRGISLTKLIEHICDLYRARLARRKTKPPVAA
jgi:predicted DNA-binding ribbon-helix-helix protein